MLPFIASRPLDGVEGPFTQLWSHLPQGIAGRCTAPRQVDRPPAWLLPAMDVEGILHPLQLQLLNLPVQRRQLYSLTHLPLWCGHHRVLDLTAQRAEPFCIPV